MRLPARSVAWVLPLFLSGCIFHHAHQPPPRQLAPALPPRRPLPITPVQLPDAATTIPPLPLETAETPAERMQRPHIRRRRAVNAEEADNAMPGDGQPPAVSAIGRLSSGDPAAYRNQTANSINAVERGLNGINRSLPASEKKIAEQIREFLKEARAALATGDVDGAHTLAQKAKVLLDELTK